jgi:hypothetical protein
MFSYFDDSNFVYIILGGFFVSISKDKFSLPHLCLLSLFRFLYKTGELKKKERRFNCATTIDIMSLGITVKNVTLIFRVSQLTSAESFCSILVVQC